MFALTYHLSYAPASGPSRLAATSQVLVRKTELSVPAFKDYLKIAPQATPLDEKAIG